MKLCPFLKAEDWEQETGEVSLALLPTSGLWGRLSGQGRAGPCRVSGAAWPGEVSRLGSSAPLTPQAARL